VRLRQLSLSPLAGEEMSSILPDCSSGAYSEGGGGQGSHALPPSSSNRRLSGFFYGKKTGFVGTVLSTRSVLLSSNMPKMRWLPGLRPGPRWGAHDAPQTP